MFCGKQQKMEFSKKIMSDEGGLMGRKQINLKDFDLILWDLDGTLVDSRQDLVDATNVAMRAMGFPLVPFDRFSKMVGKGVRHLVTEALPDEVSPPVVEKAIEIFLDWYRKHLSDNTRFYGGMLEGIRALPVLSAVVSNKREELCRSLLSRLQSDYLFCSVVGGDTCEDRKPHPAPLLHVMKSQGVPPNRVLMVGDSVVDIEAGLRAGTRVCGVLWGFGDPTENPLFSPDYLVTSPEELFGEGG